MHLVINIKATIVNLYSDKLEIYILTYFITLQSTMYIK